ncbi:hypothetical protein ACFOJE_12780 [Azotobacter bryophylli]|jgi:hypothetical protein|uniref:Cytochrome C n=1 Tax=Azotobacter bryophylli TaxID=1986537 RepID=A0ABV7AVZ5_9GAMM
MTRSTFLGCLLAALTLGGLAVAGDHSSQRDGYRRPKQLAVPADAPEVWKSECSSCHMLYAPGLLPAGAWQRQMDSLSEHYGSNASLAPEEEQAIRDFLLRASAGNRLPVEGKVGSGEPPRITGTRWFQRKHHEIGAAKFQREAVGGPHNCVACHRDAERGDFDEDRVKIPR